MSVIFHKQFAPSPEFRYRNDTAKLKENKTIFALTLLATLYLAAPNASAAKLVPLRSIAPTIQQRMAYETKMNFTGAPVPGYSDKGCLLTPSTAKALARVQQSLEKNNLSLVVFDCYRPKKAVSFFVKWTKNKNLQSEEYIYHFVPNEKVSKLISKGYIAKRSGHTSGKTVDLGLVVLNGEITITNKLSVPCTIPEATPAPLINMGTSFDCFDPKSHYKAKSVSKNHYENRQLLRSAMIKVGFKPYNAEWWHFSYRLK